MAQNSEDFRSLLNSNSGENSESTGETMRLVNSEVPKQMDELRKDIISHIIDAINSVIGEKVLLDTRKVKTSQNPVFRDEVDHRSGRLNRITEEENTGNACKTNSKPTLASGSRLNSDVSQSSDEDHVTLMTNSHEMVTAANPIPRTVPEFLTGRPMHSRTDTQNHNLPQGQSSETIPSVPETSVNCNNSDPIRRLADVLVGMSSKPSAQTLMVRPVSTTTLTFDWKSEKFELFEDFFHTMIKMQSKMSECLKINHFHSLLRKNALQTFRNIYSANRQTVEDVLAFFRRRYVKPESQATAKHKWHKLRIDPKTMKLLSFREQTRRLGKMPRP